MPSDLSGCPRCGKQSPLDDPAPADLCRCGILSNEPWARRVVIERSGGLCELCGRRGNDWAHRIGRGVGGLWIPSNGIRLCGSGTTGCDGWTTHEPVLAELGGWRIESTGEHPATVPVWLQPWLGPGWYLLDDRGCYERIWDRSDVPTLPPWVADGAPGRGLGSRP